MSWPFQAENPADRASFLLFVSVHVRKAKDDARATSSKGFKSTHRRLWYVTILKSTIHLKRQVQTYFGFKNEPGKKRRVWPVGFWVDDFT